ncbi:MAG: hypothetical protein AAF654_12470 [Myxococcota bacterium]
MARPPIESINPRERRSAKDRLRAIIERQLEQVHEAETRRDTRTEEQRIEEQYREVIQEAVDRQGQQLETDHLDEVIGQRVADAAEARILYAGKNALRHSPHRGEKISDAEIEAIDRTDHPLLMQNHAAMTAMAAQRHAMREQIPGEERIGPEAYYALAQVTRPRAMDRTGSSYTSSSSIPVEHRRELRMGMYRKMMEQIDEGLASERVANLEAEGVTDPEQLGRAGLTFQWVSRDVVRKRNRGQEIPEEDVQLVSTLREAIRQQAREVIPEWQPENPAPWIKGVEDQVFDISLAVAPLQADEMPRYEGLQDLMAGDQVFALRAPEQTGDAIGRKSSAMRREVAQTDAAADATEKAQALRPNTEWLA